LNSFRFIYIDFLYLDNKEPTHNDYANLLLASARTAFANTIDLELAQYWIASIDEKHEIGITDIHNLVGHLAAISNTKLVLVFDNIDQMRPETVADVSAVARSIFFATGHAVIVSQRPPTDAIRVEFSRGKATFFPFMITLPPPNLHDILSKRMDEVFNKAQRDGASRSSVVDGYGFKMRISNLAERTGILFKNVLTPRIQNILLAQLCNNSVRLALRAFENYVRYRDLSLNLIFDFKNLNEFPFEKHRLVVPRFSHLLDGIMIGDRTLYSELSRSSVVVNVFQFKPPDRADTFHILLYIVLCVFSTHGNFIKVSKVANWLASAGFDPRSALTAISHLTTKGLLLSPESDSAEISPIYAKITPTGQFYLDTLIFNDTYLFNVVFDTELDLDHIDVENTRFFHVKMTAVSRLIERVVFQELVLLNAISGPDANPDSARVLEAIEICGPLSLRLWRVFRKVAQSRPLRHIEDRGRFEQRMVDLLHDSTAALDKSLVSIERIIRSRSTRMVSSTNTCDHLEYKLQGFGVLEMFYPKRLGAGHPNKVEMRLAPHLRIENDVITVMWSGADQNHYLREFFEMKRTSSGKPFHGSFVVEIDAADFPFPAKSEFTFYEEAKQLGALSLAA
jgi:hypothetical protein